MRLYTHCQLQKCHVKWGIDSPRARSAFVVLEDSAYKGILGNIFDLLGLT